MHLLTILLGAYTAHAYKILAIFPCNGPSHMGVNKQVAMVLSQRGHQVDVISHFPLEKPYPNYSDILRLPDIGLATFDYEVFTSTELFEEDVKRQHGVLCHYLGLPDVSQLMAREQKRLTYDLLLVNDVTTTQCFTAIGYLLKIPVVNIVTTKLYPRMESFVGNPLNLALPSSNCWDTQDMTLWNRMMNVKNNLAEIHFYAKLMEDEEKTMRSYLGPDIPSFKSLEKMVSLILTNSHYTFNGIMPKVPAVVEIGGIQIVNDTSTMDSDLRKVLDNSNEGFIYFALGSMTLIETFPKELLQKFFNVFEKLSTVNVIMRVPKPEFMPNIVPDNVLMKSWLPQQKILQHKNIKAFVTHGGANGIQEAIYYAVPMICIPLYFEQNMNCEIVNRKRIGMQLSLHDSQSDFEKTLKDIIFHSVYKEKIRALSVLFKDRPRSPSEEAAYWIEYIARHGPHALRSPIVDLPWWQLEILDIYAVILLCFLLVLALSICLLRFFFIILIRMKRASPSKMRQLKKKSE
ncbi:hypothetical protein QAD02_017178 [Eretmocerus hayati]|uniref:Uncharacterized protein n=1 Tax=Eretmocerus hayati TaxID=131215 RepID=A0ACC2PEE4_9HYME|nr:hypothetical protein QAD02_017178 [Eretmocerus hayati]